MFQGASQVFVLGSVKGSTNSSGFSAVGFRASRV